jgi:hypothetical protein
VIDLQIMVKEINKEQGIYPLEIGGEKNWLK